MTNEVIPKVVNTSYVKCGTVMTNKVPFMKAETIPRLIVAGAVYKLENQLFSRDT
jgi:Na+/glutamate symporter